MQVLAFPRTSPQDSIRKIEADVSLLFESSGIDERIDLSSGTAQAHSIEDCLGYYGPDAVVPLGPWRKPILNEFFSVSSANRSSNNTICIVKMHQKVNQLAKNLKIGEIDSVSACHQFNSSSSNAALFDVIFESLQDRCMVTESHKRESKNLGIRIGEPELPTVTWDYTYKRQVGLHIDDWDKLRITEREQARTRLCINLGNEPRFFLVIDLTVRNLIALMQKDEQCRGNVAHDFFSLYSWYPVTRILVMPGEAYLAPTENVIHDGSTLGSSSVDICFTMLGRFALPD